jgi:sugar lactone lactonase YvrE
MAKLLDIFETKDTLGEGPLWNPRDGRLWWTDIPERRLRRLDPVTRAVDDVDLPERLGCFAFVEGRPESLLAAFETGFALYAPDSGAIDWVARPETPGSGRRFNDGRTDRQGRFWAGTMVEPRGAAPPDSARLWRLDAAGTLAACEDGIAVSNGLAVSLDGRVLYFADSPKQVIFACDLDPETGALSGKRVFAQVERGYPDGAAIDTEGCLWSARWGAGEVVRHAPDGRVIDVFRLPASQLACPVFGGPDHSVLFVTSAAYGLNGAEPAAGNLFLCDVGVAGLPDAAYRRD